MTPVRPFRSVVRGRGTRRRTASVGSFLTLVSTCSTSHWTTTYHSYATQYQLPRSSSRNSRNSFRRNCLSYSFPNVSIRTNSSSRRGRLSLSWSRGLGSSTVRCIRNRWSKYGRNFPHWSYCSRYAIIVASSEKRCGATTITWWPTGCARFAGNYAGCRRRWNLAHRNITSSASALPHRSTWSQWRRPSSRGHRSSRSFRQSATSYGNHISSARCGFYYATPLGLRNASNRCRGKRRGHLRRFRKRRYLYPFRGCGYHAGTPSAYTRHWSAHDRSGTCSSGTAARSRFFNARNRRSTFGYSRRGSSGACSRSAVPSTAFSSRLPFPYTSFLGYHSRPAKTASYGPFSTSTIRTWVCHRGSRRWSRWSRRFASNWSAIRTVVSASIHPHCYSSTISPVSHRNLFGSIFGSFSLSHSNWPTSSCGRSHAFPRPRRSRCGPVGWVVGTTLSS